MEEFSAKKFRNTKIFFQAQKFRSSEAGLIDKCFLRFLWKIISHEEILYAKLSAD